jgi:hypothetical protein
MKRAMDPFITLGEVVTDCVSDILDAFVAMKPESWVRELAYWVVLGVIVLAVLTATHVL